MKAVMDINRLSGDGNHRMEFVIKLDVGKSITATMSAEDFTLAVTGRSEIPVELRTRNAEIKVIRKRLDHDE